MEGWGGEGITQMFRICWASNAGHYPAPDPTGGNTHAWPRLQASPQLLSSSGLGEAPSCCPEQQPQTGVSLKSPRPEGPALLCKPQVLCDASKTTQLAHACPVAGRDRSCHRRLQFSQGSLSTALMDGFPKVTSLIGLSDPRSLSDFPLGGGGSRY